MNVTHFYNTTRTTLSNSSYSTLWSYTINKLYDENTSNLQLYCLLPGHENWSDVCGINVHIQNSTSRLPDGVANYAVDYDFFVYHNASNMSSAYHDIWYIGADSGNETFAISSISKEFSNLSAGTHTVNFGWKTRSGSATDKPFVVWNLNSSDDSRQHQTRSHCTIFEVRI